jgi:hypothetical protein
MNMSSNNDIANVLNRFPTSPGEYQISTIPDNEILFNNLIHNIDRLNR